VREGDDGGDRSEDLLACDAVGVRDVVEDRGLDEVAALEALRMHAIAANRQLGFALADLLVLADTIELFAADERAHLRVPIERPADRDRLRLLDHRLDEPIVDWTLDQDAAAGGADLALIEEHAEECTLDRVLEIRIGEEDVRRLAAELERNLLQRCRS